MMLFEKCFFYALAVGQGFFLCFVKVSPCDADRYPE